MFFPNDAKRCSKKSLKQLNRKFIYKFTRSNFKCRRRRRRRRWRRRRKKKQNWLRWVELGTAKKGSPGFHPLVKLSRIEVQESKRSVGIP